MKASELKIGEKYVPMQKTDGAGLAHSTNWKRAKAKKQPYLYYRGNNNGHHVFSVRKGISVDGDFFSKTDVVPYKQKKVVKSPTLKLGTKVKLSPLSKYCCVGSTGPDSNNPIGMEGKIYALGQPGLMPFRVKWKNGKTNEYYAKDLIIITKIKKQTKVMPKETTFTVDKKFLLSAHASACSEWKEKIKKKFPEAFKKAEFFFGDKIVLTTHGGYSPLFIGQGLSPNGLKGRCLIVANDYKMKTQTLDGYTILSFTKK